MVATHWLSTRPTTSLVHPLTVRATLSYTGQVCRHNVNAEDLKAICREQLAGFFFSSGQLQMLLTAADEEITEREELLVASDAELARLTSEMDKVMRLYLNEKPLPEQVARRIQVGTDEITIELHFAPELQKTASNGQGNHTGSWRRRVEDGPGRRVAPPLVRGCVQPVRR